MKFALIALVATAASIKITTTTKKCKWNPVSQARSDKIFEQVDTNNNGSVSIEEIREALKEHTRFDKHGIDAVCDMAEKDAGKDHALDKEEFNKLANAVSKDM